ncbi:MAG: Uma2 family endonuclease [Phycisphaeraceae bacterium]
MTRAASNPTTSDGGKRWVPPQQGEWTIADYMRLVNPPRFYYEMIKGHIIMSPTPNLYHQRTLMALAVPMSTFVRSDRFGEVLIAPLDVEIDLGETQTIVEPDIIYVSNERREVLTSKHLRGAPDLLVEIVSPSSADRDRGDKLTLYMTNGVLEYWVVDPDVRTIEMWVMREFGHVKKGEWVPGQTVESEVLKGFSVKVEEVCPAP